MNISSTIAGSPTSRWYRLPAILLACLLFTVLFAIPAHATAPSAGSVIGNQASATYTDASGINRSVTSNTVQTIVQQVASLTLTANGAQTSTPGTTVYYPHTLTNTGNGSDSYTLTAVNGSGFNMTGIQIYADNGSGQPTGSPITSSGALAAGATFKFIVVATVPATATTGQTNALTVTAKSVFDATQTQSNTDTTTVTSNAVIALTKSVSASSGAAGSGPYTYTLTYTNTGNSTATSVTLTDVVPTGMAYQAGTSLWSVTGGTALSDSGGTSGSAPNTIVSSYTSGTTTLKYVINQVAPGQSGTITFQVKVNSGVAPGTINNVATESYNDGSGTTVNGSSNTVPFTVNQTAGVTLTPPAAVASANPGQTVSFVNVVTNTGNGTDTFNVTLGSNTFPSGTAFTLYKSDGVTPLTDTNGDGTPDTGPLAAGATYNVIVKAQLPANASGSGPFTLNKTATSVFDPTKTATATDTLTSITGASVDLTNDSAYNTTTPAPGQGAGPEAGAIKTNTTAPGQSTTFAVYVNNTGPVSDSYTLSASTDSSFGSTTLPTGWTVTFKADAGGGTCSSTGATITSTGAVAAGGNMVVCAVVSVPASGVGAAAGTSNLYFRGASPASGASDRIHDAVAVGALRSISYTPNNTNQTYPGGTVVYSHTLTNNGNVTEGDGTKSTIALASANSKSGWTSVLYYDANNNGTLDSTDPVVPASGLQGILPGGLAPGQSVTIFDKVTAPSGATVGDINTATITVSTANGSYTTTAPATVTATDGTTVIAGNLQLTKAQALDASCSGSVGSYSAAVLNAKPGQCVMYQITVTNVGSADATTVVVSDSTPTYTTLSTAPATTVGTVTGPAANTSGTVSATIGTLAPGASAVVTFGVKIQQ